MKKQDKNIILIGGGGHCKSCIDVIEREGIYNIVGILDKTKTKGEKIFDYVILGSDDDIQLYKDKDYYFLVTVGQIKSSVARKSIYSRLEAINVKIATVISPLAYVSPRAIIAKGCVVMHGVRVNAGATIGYNCIINTGSVIEHDARVGHNTHISTQAVINGDCVIGEEVFIGSNSTISSQITICNNTIIGAGTVVNKTINEQGIYVGNPARKIG